MASLAIVKPDHLGDLVLAAPAIRALTQETSDATLFVSSAAAGLARFLFPDLADQRVLDFPHLSRKPAAEIPTAALAAALSRYDRLVCLRDDPILRALLDAVTGPDKTIIQGDHRLHDSILHKRAIHHLTGPYSRTRLFSGAPLVWPTQIRRVGLCIAAGFPTNRWPVGRWLDLAMALIRRGILITWIGGPGERDELTFLTGLLGYSPCAQIEGGADFGQFFGQIADLDLIIATDGGTAHIASLRRPILSLFGSSPWQRYAPFGRNNVVITRQEVCSPCLQFSTAEVNGCLTRECMAGLTVETILGALDSNGIDFSLVRGATAERGASHRL